jgi:hypothetical protein
MKSKLPAATPTSTSKPGPKEKQNQTPTTGPTPAIPDLKSVNADLKKANTPDALNKPAPAGSALAKEQERRKKQSSTTATSESYDAYDLVLEYLLSQGHVETVEEANYVMLVMDAETIGTIVEGSGVVVGASKVINTVMKPTNQTPEQEKKAVGSITKGLDVVAKPIKSILSPVDNSKKAQQERIGKRRP